MNTQRRIEDLFIGLFDDDNLNTVKVIDELTRDNELQNMLDDIIGLAKAHNREL